MDMEKEKLGQEPAFACESSDGHIQVGMSKRFYAACAAMQGLLANSNVRLTYEKVVEDSFEFADELLKQESDEEATE